LNGCDLQRFERSEAVERLERLERTDPRWDRELSQIITISPSDESRAAENGADFLKTVTAGDLQKKVKECVDAAQNDRVVVTRRGRPAAVLVGVEGSDWEDVVLQSSRNFWRLIEERRMQPTISLHDLKTRLQKRKR
jgi:prevent-host-death family protein